MSDVIQCECKDDDKSRCQLFGHGPMYSKATWHYPKVDFGFKDIEFADTQEKGFALDINGGYYFWDESEADCFGPFNTLEHAKKALNAYARDVL